MTTKRNELRGVTKPLFSKAFRGIRRVQGWMTLALLMPIVLLAEEGRAQSAVDGFDPGADRNVKALAVQPDGKILVVGDFLKLGGGGTGVFTRNLIGRLNLDGTLDMSFDPGAGGASYDLRDRASGRKDSGWWIFHHARWRRKWYVHAQLYRTTLCRWHAGQQLRSRCE